MGKNGRLRTLSRQLIELLKSIPDKIEVETGVELLPVVKFFVKIRIINLSMKDRRGICHESKEENVECLHDHVEGALKRNET